MKNKYTKKFRDYLVYVNPGLIIAKNLKNEKYQIFKMEHDKKNRLKYVKYSKPYEHISHRAPDQDSNLYVEFIAQNKGNLYLLLNDKKVIKVRKFEKKIANGALRSQDFIKVANEPLMESFKGKVNLLKQEDGLLLIHVKDIGEVLYDTKYGNLSTSYKYISSPDEKGIRIVVLPEPLSDKNELAYMDKSFGIIGEKFNSFVSNPKVLVLGQPNLEIISDGEKQYFINEKRIRCSRKYDYIANYNNFIVGHNYNKGKMVILNNNTLKEVTPYFIDSIEMIEDKNKIHSLVLRTSTHHNECVIYNPNLTENNISTKITKADVNLKYNLVFGNIELDESGEKVWVVFNTDFPDKAYKVDPNIGLLMMSYLNETRLGSKTINKVINNQAVIESSLNAFNDCINQSIPEKDRTPITNRYNICSKFMTRIKNRANDRVKRCEKQTELLNKEIDEMDREYFGFIESYEEQLAELERQKREKQQEYMLNRQRKEDEILIRNNEIDNEKDELEIKHTKAEKYKQYVIEVKAKNPDAEKTLLEESEDENTFEA